MIAVGEISQFTFISSWMHTLSALPLRFPDIAPSIDYQATPPGNNLIDLVHDPKRVQRKLTSQYVRSVASYTTEHAGAPREAARLRYLERVPMPVRNWVEK